MTGLEAYKLGVEGFAQGKRNPFKRSSKEALHWADGYRDARARENRK